VTETSETFVVNCLVAALGLSACGREDIQLGRQEVLTPQPTMSVGGPPDLGATADAVDASLPLAVDASAPTTSYERVDASSPEPVVPAMTDASTPEPVAPATTDASSSEPLEPNVPPDDCSAAVPRGLLGARPPMGWNGYNALGEDPELDEDKVRSVVDALVDSGMQSAGYRYVNLDIGWQLARSDDGARVFDPVRLPGGIEALVEWVHGRGFLFGAYSHIQNCAQMAGGEGYEAMDAASYAAWGVDYLKYVNCAPEPPMVGAVSDLAAELAAADRSIVLSLAAPPFQEWMRDVAQLWRVSGDARPTWSSIVNSIDAAVPLAAYARPGAFNDPDMLEIGNGSLTEGQQRVQFSVWSILAAPLIAGNDVTAMTETTRAILTNLEVIALDQDPLGLQGASLGKVGDIEILAKPLAECGARAVVLWNRSTTSAEASFSWEDVWLEPAAATVRDLWNDSSLETSTDGVTVVVPARDAVALRVDGVERPLPRGTVYLSDLPWTYVTNGYGPVEIDRTNGEAEPLDGAPIRLRGAAHEKGLGVHSPSLIRYRLAQACSRFVADVGIDDDQEGDGSVQFEIWADGERLFRSGLVTGASPTLSVDVDVRGRRELRLFVSMGGDTYSLDHAVWAGAALECDP
jgi:alpha-galactosidase